MTKSPCERIIAAIAAYLLANLGTYITRANLGTTGYQAPAPKVCAKAVGIPDNGPYPYVMVNRDSIAVEPSANNAQRITMQISVNVGINESKTENADIVADRYTDALIDLFGENLTLGGTVDIAMLKTSDKLIIPSSGEAYVICTVEVTSEVSTA